MATQDRLPTGTGASNQWTSINAVDKWLEVDDPIGSHDSDATYLFSAGANNNQTFTFSAFAITASAFASLSVIYFGRRTAAGLADMRTRIRVNGTFYAGTVDNQFEAWTGWQNDYLTNPNTGSAWTEADIEGTSASPLQEFGFVAAGVGATEEVQCTQCYATVTYTPVSAGNPWHAYAQQ